MNKHTEYPELEDLPALIKQQRRLLAGQLRITTEERAIREAIAKKLAEAGVTGVSCACEVGGQSRDFDITTYNSSRDGKQRVRVIRTR